MMDYPDWVQPAATQECVAAGCRAPAASDDDTTAPRPRPSVPGTDLCSWHRAQFPRVLNDVALSWRDLEGALYRRAPEQGTRVRTSTVSDLSQSWNPHVSELMADLTDWTAFVVRTVLKERPLPAATAEWTPTGGRQISEHYFGLRTDTTPDVALAALARHHAHWLVGYPALGAALLSDALEYRRRVLRTLDTPSVRRVGIRNAICGHVLDTTDDGLELTCLHPMVAILRDDDRPSTLVCSAHPLTHRQYTPDEFMGLGR